MVCHLAVGAMLAPGTHGLYHVGQPQPATVLRIAMCQWYLAPLFILRAAQVDRPLKLIGVGGADGAFCAIDLDVGQAMVPDIEACNNCAGGPAGEIDYARDVRRSIDGYPGTGFRCAADDAFGEGSLS